MAAGFGKGIDGACPARGGMADPPHGRGHRRGRCGASGLIGAGRRGSSRPLPWSVVRAWTGASPASPTSSESGTRPIATDPTSANTKIKPKGRPPSFAHYDAAAATGGFEIGPSTPLPTSEDQPHCRTSGHRVVVVHTHRSSEPAADSTMKATLRSIVKRMNWKIVQQSALSSGGARTVEMAVDCNAEGQINVYDVVVSDWHFDEVSSAVKEELGDYYGSGAVKYLTFDHKGIAGRHWRSWTRHCEKSGQRERQIDRCRSHISRILGIACGHTRALPQLRRHPGRWQQSTALLDVLRSLRRRSRCPLLRPGC